MPRSRSGVAVGLTVPAAIVVGSLAGSPAVALAIVAGALTVGWRLVPGFWKTAGRGILAGAVAGVLVLGPGLRLAMRVVAIFEPLRRPEFTLEGTAFVVVVIGLLFGGITGGWTTLVASSLGVVSRRVGTGVITVAASAQLFSSSEVLAELTELGAGPWMNVPMFLGVTVLYGYLTDRWARPVVAADASIVRDASGVVGMA